MVRSIIMVLSILALIVIIVLEFIFIRFSFFNLFPHIGIVFHLVGGACCSLLICQLFVFELKQVNFLTKSIFVIGSVSLLAVGWEGFEWLLGHSLVCRNMQGSLDDTMFDLLVGIIASLLGLLFQKLLDRVLHNKFFN